ncbi:hypothetical protein F2P81_018038 [Scophthalmus maximus]|uniref:G-protein coupled receptors family 1 profile domain-containing protein n=1 Tax=Scophthalmus maximus TaxID=52904 RepID=A0A6A4S3J1_SCOMX|nr:hypothetical protein F2P81_018038 [Scophthalmus maximus]
MEAVSAANDTGNELRLLPDDDPGNLAYRDYDSTAAVLPTLVFEGVNFPEDPIRLLSVQVVLILAYSTIIVLGVLGNSLVIYVIYRFKSLRTRDVTDQDVHLRRERSSGTVGKTHARRTPDLLVNTLCLPFTLVYTLQGEWKFGGTLCFLLPYAQGLAVHVSTVTLNVIALDRHRANPAFKTNNDNKVVARSERTDSETKPSEDANAFPSDSPWLRRHVHTKQFVKSSI